MPHLPWASLAALIATIVTPFLPSWLFEGRRPSRTGHANRSAASAERPGPAHPSTGLWRLRPSRADQQPRRVPPRQWEQVRWAS
jgi:hypothetical protein